MNLRAPATAAAFTPPVTQLAVAPELAALALLEAALEIASAALVAAQPELMRPDDVEPSTDSAQVAALLVAQALALRGTINRYRIALVLDPRPAPQRPQRARIDCQIHDPGVDLFSRAETGHSWRALKLLSSSPPIYRARVADQIAIASLTEEAKALRFRLRSGIMREALGDDDVRERESWAVPVGIAVRDGAPQLAVVTTRCVLDYRYPLDTAMPQWSNLAFFSSPGLPPGRQDVGHEVFRVGVPVDLPGVTGAYDPQRDAWFVTTRRYLDGPLGDRYFNLLKVGQIPSASVELPVGDWTTANGVDLAVVYIPLSDPGAAALIPDRTLRMNNPAPALRAVLTPQTSLWGDTFNFALVSQECMKYAAKDHQDALDDAARWRALAIAAGAVIAVAYFAPGFVAIDSEFIERLGNHVVRAGFTTFWRTEPEPLLGAAFRGASWNLFGKLALRMALANGTVREYIVGGLSSIGLAPEAADAVLNLLAQVLQDPSARVATMDRPDGPPVASVLVPSAQVDFAADLLRRGIARLDPSDVQVLAQQPTLFHLAEDAIADPDARTMLIEDDRYQRVLRNVAAALAE